MCLMSTSSDDMPLYLFIDAGLDVGAQVAVRNQVNLVVQELFQILTKPHEVVKGRLVKLNEEVNVAL